MIFRFPTGAQPLREWRKIVALSRGPVLVIIDEFTRLMMTSHGVDSAFQFAWDHRLSELPNMRLILNWLARWHHGARHAVGPRAFFSGEPPITSASVLSLLGR